MSSAESLKALSDHPLDQTSSVDLDGITPIKVNPTTS